MKQSPAFTLAELLVALAILGVIATFTIPKVLVSQQNDKNNAITKEAAGAVVSALTLYKNERGIDASVTMGALLPYLNYVKLDDTSIVDEVGGGGPFTCSSTGAGTCVKLHNGAMIWYWNNVSFDGTGTMNAIFFKVDPDGTTSDQGAINIFIYTNGRVRSEGTIEPGTISSDFTRSPNASLDPTWWDNWN